MSKRALLIVFCCAGCGTSPMRVVETGGDLAMPATLDTDMAMQPTCVGYECQIAGCMGGVDTIITGRVFAPNGLDPVPGAVVYVPNQGLAEFPAGASCDLCNAVDDSAASAQTAFDGTFKMTHVPSGAAIPIVIQLGRFRRVLSVNVTACTTMALQNDKGSPGQRLPRKDSELSATDSVPRIAVATGDWDQIECVLSRMGLTQFDLYSDRDPGMPPATIATLESLLTDGKKLLGYNILVVNCTNNQFEPLLAQASVRANLAAFVAAGGRLYATDWAYDAIEQVPEFSPYMCFAETGVAPTCSVKPQVPGDADSYNNYDNSALIKDPNLAEWLAQFPGVIDNTKHVAVAYSFVVVDAVSSNVMTYPTEVWVEGPTGALGTKPMTVTFDYQQCGRVHYSTYNTEPNGVVPDNTRYPNCIPTFSPQERILEYLVFEIANCIGTPG